MHFIDEAKIYLKAGDGGKGCISFHREKFVEQGGPDGGNGGRGGNIIFKADPNLNTLIDFRYKQHFKADKGVGGRGRNCTGASGEDMYIIVPVGTQIFSEDGQTLLFDVDDPRKEYLMARGGNGGRGNINYKSSVNQAPRRATPGYPGDELWVWLKLKLLSDVGLVGLPNAGKSTFLSIVSSAKPKIADYPFTTIKPQLGVVLLGHQDLVIADLPGLIEGASEGHGLGDKFLKHIERCKILLHLIDGNSDVAASYTLIRKELETFSAKLKDKLEIVCLNKTDLLSEDELKAKLKALKKVCKNKVFTCSGATTDGIDKIVKHLFKEIKGGNALD
ncbi:MAG: GTPase ObgE [Rickettsiales bacterium]